MTLMDPVYTDKFLATIREAAPSEPAVIPDDPQIVLYRLFDGIVRGDFDAVGELMTDDIDLTISGFPAIDGHWHGRDAVIAAAKRNFGLLENQQPKVEAMISSGDSTAVLIHERGLLKPGGQAYNIRAVEWFTFQNGKIKKVDQSAAAI